MDITETCLKRTNAAWQEEPRDEELGANLAGHLASERPLKSSLGWLPQFHNTPSHKEGDGDFPNQLVSS